MPNALRLSLAAAAMLALSVTSPASAQNAEASTMAWPDKGSSALVFASRQVTDMDRSVAFYTKVMGMQVVGGNNPANGSIKETFLAFDRDPKSAKIALLARPTRTEPLPAGERFYHTVFQVADVKAICDKIPAAGGKVTRAPAKAGTTNVTIAMTEDPDGHVIELLQRD
jgi:lactoylglutathione lyase